MAKVKAAEEKMEIVKKGCTIIQLDTNSDAWKAEVEQLRKDRVRRNGSSERVGSEERNKSKGLGVI